MNLLKSLLTISTMTIVSRLFGFIRDIILARMFGASMEMDAFVIAFKLPNSLRRIFAEGAFSQAFIPILVEYKNQRGKQETNLLISNISGFMSIVLLLVTVLGIIYAPQIIFITAPGFSKNYDKFNTTVSLLKIVFPYIFLISLSALSSAVLNTWNVFYVPAISPTLLNISIIFFAIFISPYCQSPIISIAWSVILGGILQLIYQLIYLQQLKLLLIPKFNLRNLGVVRILKKMLPAMLGVSASHASIMLNTIFSSFLISGSISWMYYADRLMELPTGVLGAALSTILLPNLAKKFTVNNQKDYRSLMDWGLKISFLLTLPSAVILAILSKPLILSLFQYNKFSNFDAKMTQYTLIAYSFGLVGLIIVKVLVAGFYSRQNIKTPVTIAIITLILTQIMNLLFVNVLQHVGLALSISIAANFNAIVLYWQLKKKKLFYPQPGWRLFFIKLFISLLVMAIILLTIMQFITISNNIFLNIINLLFICIISMCTYLFMLKLFGFSLKDFYYFYDKKNL